MAKKSHSEIRNKNVRTLMYQKLKKEKLKVSILFFFINIQKIQFRQISFYFKRLKRKPK